MELTNAEDLIDEVWGKIGTPERDEMGRRIAREIKRAKRRRRRKRRKTRGAP